MYRSLAEKEALLDAALEWGDGDLVLAVTLHLRRHLTAHLTSHLTSHQD